jgi:hypothetical protein
MRIKLHIVGFEISTAIAMNNFIFWDITPCSLVKPTVVSEERTRLRLQGDITPRSPVPEEHIATIFKV